MEGDLTIFDWMKLIVFWTSPFLFIVGIVLVLYGNYKRLEEILGKEFWGVKIMPALETSIYTFQEWLLERRTLVGLICVILSLIIFFVLR